MWNWMESEKYQWGGVEKKIFIYLDYSFQLIYCNIGSALKSWSTKLITLKKKEGNMDKKYLKKMVTGLSIAGLVTGIGGLAIGAGG